MQPNGSLVSSYMHMGRSEAPLFAEIERKRFLDESTENHLIVFSRGWLRPRGQDAVFVERLGGVESKYNERGTVLQCNSIQTTLARNNHTWQGHTLLK